MSLSPKQMVIDYFHFVDTEDLSSILELLARDCVFTVETHAVRLTGDKEITAMLSGFGIIISGLNMISFTSLRKRQVMTLQYASG